MTQMVLVYNPWRCTGCTSCMIACSYKHYGVLDYNLSNIKISFAEELKRFEAVYCHHCEEPICATVCPVSAIVKDEDTGIVTIDVMKCIGCQLCNVMCPLSVPWFNEALRVSIKCDLCDGDPECVKFCSSRALRFVPREEATALLKEIYKE
ncbi:MAG: 4Fe-4S dicluster domain-containing protein [Candidatus Baldrarchaeia archaeon]